MNGKLIVIDGLDGSGKTTQSQRVADALRAKGTPVRLISFPDYGEESSALVRMYLNGEFSASPSGVNAYAASSFYAVDRYASFKKHWEKDYLSGHTILATRYVSSNAIHQMCKLPESQWGGYLQWLSDFEYGRLGLPRPDRIIFLNMSRVVADRLILSRYHGDEGKKDIHEKDRAYLASCQRTAAYAAQAEGWSVVDCDDGEAPLPLDAITKKILSLLENRAEN
ncbi:MAG: dTMP kinase [Candidatus Merdivicinus sp.]|jgi:dTMP kinase